MTTNILPLPNEIPIVQVSTSDASPGVASGASDSNEHSSGQQDEQVTSTLGHLHAECVGTFTSGLEEWRAWCSHPFTEQRTYPGAPEQNDRHGYLATVAADGRYVAEFLLPEDAEHVIACEHEQLLLKGSRLRGSEVAR